MHGVLCFCYVTDDRKASVEVGRLRQLPLVLVAIAENVPCELKKWTSSGWLALTTSSACRHKIPSLPSR